MRFSFSLEKFLEEIDPGKKLDRFQVIKDITGVVIMETITEFQKEEEFKNNEKNFPALLARCGELGVEDRLAETLARKTDAVKEEYIMAQFSSLSKEKKR